jgi:hypothetical protein
MPGRVITAAETERYAPGHIYELTYRRDKRSERTAFQELGLQATSPYRIELDRLQLTPPVRFLETTDFATGIMELMLECYEEPYPDTRITIYVAKYLNSRPDEDALVEVGRIEPYHRGHWITTSWDRAKTPFEWYIQRLSVGPLWCRPADSYETHIGSQEASELERKEVHDAQKRIEEYERDHASNAQRNLIKAGFRNDHLRSKRKQELSLLFVGAVGLYALLRKAPSKEERIDTTSGNRR